MFRALPWAAEGLGAESWYYEAKKLEQSGESDPAIDQSIDFMYSLAFYFGEKAAAREAGRALIQRSAKRADLGSMKTTALLWFDYFGPDWEIYRTLISSCMGAGDFKYAIDTIDTLRAVFPSTAKTKANELAFYEYSSRASLGDFSWAKASLALLKVYTPDTWNAKVLRLAALGPEIDEETKALCLMRADYQEKKFTEAAIHAAGAGRFIHDPGAAALPDIGGRKILHQRGREDAKASLSSRNSSPNCKPRG